MNDIGIVILLLIIYAMICLIVTAIIGKIRHKLTINKINKMQTEFLKNLNIRYGYCRFRVVKKGEE